VKAALANGLEPLKVRGPHFAIDKDPETAILQWIEAQGEKCDPLTRTHLCHYGQANNSVTISRGWVDSFTLRHRDVLAETKSTPQEDTRLEVTRVFLNETIRCLREYVQGMKAGLVFNIDKVGYRNGKIAGTRKWSI
jgi:hypothetical protein